MKKVYLDQCVLSHVVGEPLQDWKTTTFGKVLWEAVSTGAAEVWASPTHVLETLLCADYDKHGSVIDGSKTQKRTKIARTLLELCEGKRMFCSYEFLLVGEFLELLRQLAPDCIRTDGIYNRLKKDNQMIFSGALALLAALPTIDRPSATEEIIRSKLTTQLLHSRFAKNPDGFVDELIAVATEFRLTNDNLFKEIDSRTLSSIQEEISSNLKSPGTLSKKSRTLLGDNRSSIASAYGSVEIGQCLDAVFSDIFLVLLTFDTMALRRQWNSLCQTLKVKISMPKKFALADEDSCVSDPMIAVSGLEQFFRHVCRDALMSPQISNQIILSELETTLNNGQVPTGGIGFDAEHAAILSHVDVFATTDTKLEKSTKTAAKKIHKATKGKWNVQVVTNADQLAKSLR